MARGLWTLAATATAGMLALLARRTVRYAVSGDSMAPTLAAGDWVLARRVSTVRPGEIVVVERPDRPGLEIIKRVVAVEADGPGEAMRARLAGDNPLASTDSRDFGPVPVETVVGVVWLRYWPPGRVRVFGPAVRLRG